MNRLMQTLKDALSSEPTGAQSSAAVLIGILMWLGVSGAVWNAYPGSVWPFIVAMVPAVIAYGAVIVITELKGWY